MLILGLSVQTFSESTKFSIPYPHPISKTNSFQAFQGADSFIVLQNRYVNPKFASAKALILPTQVTAFSTGLMMALHMEET